jgi:uncharacterized membrane protein YpjA
MRSAAGEIAYAVLAWLIPFAASVCLFPLKSSRPPLFDTSMGVILTASTVALGVAYLKVARERYLATGLRIGAQWTVANWLLDGLMFSGGPMKMSLGDYLMDIGLAYLAIPAITIGLGLAAAGSARRAA